MIIRTTYKDIVDARLAPRALELQLSDSSFAFLVADDNLLYMRVAVLYLYSFVWCYYCYYYERYIAFILSPAYRP